MSHPADSLGRVDALSDDDRRILEFEREWWRLRTPKERAVRDRLGLSVTRYYQRLNALLDRPSALAFDPMLVGRLRRLRERRRHIRFARRLAGEL
jgi:hypothetical protein